MRKIQTYERPPATFTVWGDTGRLSWTAVCIAEKTTYFGKNASIIINTIIVWYYSIDVTRILPSPFSTVNQLTIF